MNAKFFRRTLRSLVFRDRPYFAHLALTHRCNLRCRFCHVTELQFKELGTEGMKRVVDVLDRTGVAIVSISGGGEPLLRDDFDEIIDYAASRGLYVKLTSNGTMPRAKYERLLRSRVDEIGISLDGVRGQNLPFSHVGSPILRNLQYLNDCLPAGKHLTINVTVSEENRGEVEDILDYCSAHYPRARVWLNPVVVGEGALRTQAPGRARPDYLSGTNSPTLLRAPFYARGAEEQYQKERFDWGCRAGDLFFDVKPNGDYWLCQDQPSRAPLNVLDSCFAERRKQVDKGQRRECSGCIYSCYYLIQKSLEAQNWRDMALLWWQANTEPGGPERRAAEKYGPAGALAFLLWRGFWARAMQPALRAIAIVWLAWGLMAGPPVQEADPEEILTLMEWVGAQQRDHLGEWTNDRTYRAGNVRLGRHATAKVRMDYTAPGSKHWSIVESSGSALILNKVIKPLLEAEQEGAIPAIRRMSDIDRSNYSFRYVAYDEELRAYVFEASPRSPSKYQFRGWIAVDAATHGVRRVWGEPARRPSFWVRTTRFVHDYGQVSHFWLPVRHRTKVELRWFGESTLEIDYAEYQLRETNGRTGGTAANQGLRPTASLLTAGRTLATGGLEVGVGFFEAACFAGTGAEPAIEAGPADLLISVPASGGLGEHGSENGSGFFVLAGAHLQVGEFQLDDVIARIAPVQLP
jgi:hypothetical protein